MIYLLTKATVDLQGPILYFTWIFQPILKMLKMVRDGSLVLGMTGLDKKWPETMGYEDLKWQNDQLLKIKICHFKLILLLYTSTEVHISVKH